jgi:transcriptional antiterminator NusG
MMNDPYYGCVFCKTGSEQTVAHMLSQKGEGMQALAVTQYKHKSKNGIKTIEESILLPGYVFFQCENAELSFSFLYTIADVIRLLRSPSGDWRIANDDCQFIKWVFQNEGIISVSKAYSLGDKVRILSGPLKDLEGNIIRIDRRSRNGMVEIRIHDKAFHVWLAFEVVDIQEATCSNCTA